MRSSFLSYSPPFIGPEEIAEVVSTLETDWITTGPKTRQFESEFAEYIGAPAALAVFSATDAMPVALAALGVGPGDDVVTTTMTFCSTVHVIEHLGARPVLVDVKPDTLCLDPAAVERALTPRTRGILPVHIYGHPCDMDDILALAGPRRLFVLEDAAHALPASYHGRRVGTIGTATAFSFYATKNMTTAEGGMLTGDSDLIGRARMWSLHGMSRDAYKRYSAEGSWFYEVVLPGFKCNMTDIQASLGLQQLRKLPRFQERRREIVRQYQAAFGSVPALQTPVELDGTESAWHIYPVRLRLDLLDIDRSQFIEELKARNIGTSVHFIPIHLHPYYRDKYGFSPGDFPVALENYRRLVSLPLHPRLSDQDVEDVIEAVSDVVPGTCADPHAVRGGIPRWVEAGLAAAGIVLCSPLLVAAALGVRATSPGPVLFRQVRVGRGGRPFTLLKFRTMRVNRAAPGFTAADDPRITAVGRWLRRLKLDEIPQLWNVLRGDMSLVGPRPEVPRYVDLDNPLWRRVLQVRPGITDPVTLRLRNEEELLSGVAGDKEAFYLQKLQPYKLEGYLEYLDRRSPWSDVGVVLQTLRVVPAGAPSGLPGDWGTVSNSRPDLAGRRDGAAEPPQD